MRSGEAWRLKWIDLDQEKRIVTVNDPEKHGLPWQLKISDKLVSMLNMIPKKGETVWPGDRKSRQQFRVAYIRTRNKVALNLQNPRLLNISFHTFRDWKATMLYHKTKDPYYVKDFLGHKCLSNTEIYINIVCTLFEDQRDEVTVKVAEKPEDTKALLEAGFEYVCQKDNLVCMRKRKWKRNCRFKTVVGVTQIAAGVR
jgi:integrase